MQPSVDLLFTEADCRVDVTLLERALVFGFSAGDTNRAFERAVETARCPGSSFKESSFSKDLFVEELVDLCFKIRVGAKTYAPCKPYLKRVLCSPSNDLKLIVQRQDLLRQLIHDAALRGQVERLYASLRTLRETLASGDFSTRIDPNQRRLEILRSFAAIVRDMGGLRVTNTALQRLIDFSRHVNDSPGFRFLDDLLQYEERHAQIDVRLQLGSDGAIRHFEVVSSATAAGPFHASWTVRLWQRLVLFLRGYRVTDNEVLSRLVFRAFEGIKDSIPPLFQILGDLEFYLGALHWWHRAAAEGYEMSFPELLPPEHKQATELRQLFNPFLVAEGVRAIPADITAAPCAITILTGPNSGGKTRLMQALALAQLLGQAGLPVPAKQARINLARGLFVSMFEQVRADQPEGRLGMELLRIRRLFEEMHPGDVVVLDELCSGTNPSEGEEIFQLVLELIAQLEPQVWISTHFLQLAQRLQKEHGEGNHPQLAFLRVVLDEEERPTYCFDQGVAATSLAGQTAARLGVTRSELQRLVGRARARASTDESQPASVTPSPEDRVQTGERSPGSGASSTV